MMSLESTRMMEDDPKLLIKSDVVKCEVSQWIKSSKFKHSKDERWRLGGRTNRLGLLGQSGSKMEMYKNIQTTG